jgi:hypothetical protein
MLSPDDNSDIVHRNAEQSREKSWHLTGSKIMALKTPHFTDIQRSSKRTIGRRHKNHLNRSMPVEIQAEGILPKSKVPRNLSHYLFEAQLYYLPKYRNSIHSLCRPPRPLTTSPDRGNIANGKPTLHASRALVNVRIEARQIWPHPPKHNHHPHPPQPPQTPPKNPQPPPYPTHPIQNEREQSPSSSPPLYAISSQDASGSP